MSKRNGLVVGLHVLATLCAVQGAAKAQQVEAPASVPAADTAALDASLRGVFQSAYWRDPIEALRKEHGDPAVMDGLIRLLLDERAAAGVPFRASAYETLAELLGDTPAEDGALQARLAEAVLVGLADQEARRVALQCAPHIGEEQQPQLVSALVPLLDDPEPVVVTEVCRTLARLGPAARIALPNLEAVVREPAAAGSRDRFARIARTEAARARLCISGDVTLDADLYPGLDTEGQLAVAGPVAELLVRLGVPAGVEDEPRRALAAYYLGWLDGLNAFDPDAMDVALALPRLLSDETDASVRDAAQQLLERWAQDADPQRSDVARPLLKFPEAPHAKDGGPPTDPRVELLFRPRSTLLTAAETPRGLMAVSCCTRDTSLASFPPTISMLFVWDVESERLVRRIDGVRGAVLSAALAANGSFLVVGTRGSQPGRPADGLVVCPLDGESAPYAIPGHEAGVRELRLFPDGVLAASIGEDRVVRITDLEARKVLRAWAADEHDPPVSLAVRPDGKRVFVGGAELTLRLFDPEADTCLETGTTRDESRTVPAEVAGYVHGDARMPSAAAFLPDGERLLVGDPTGRLAVWDPSSDGPPTIVAESGSPIAAIALSEDGRQTLTAFSGTWMNGSLRHPANFTIEVRDTAAGAPVTSLTGMASPPELIAVLADGERVLGVSAGALRIWRLAPR